MSTWKCYIILIIFQISLIQSENVRYSEAITDFLLTQKGPTKISVHLCWSNTDKILLARYLNKYSFNFHYFSHEIQPFTTKTPSEQLFLTDLRCPESRNLLNMANQHKLFQQPYRWLVIANNFTSLPHFLEIMVDSQFYVIQKLSSELYSLYSPYQILSNTIINDIGSWSPTVSFNYFNELSIIRNRTDLKGIKVNISCVFTNSDSLNHLWDYRNKHIDPISKVHYILSHHLADFLNVSSYYIIRNTWGYRNATTNMYDGLIGDLQSGLAEFAGTGSFFTLDRIYIVDYIAPSVPTPVRFIFRAPPLSYVRNVFTLPFDKMVWYAGCFSVAIISVSIYIISKWEWSDYKFRDASAKRQNAMKPKYIDVLLMELGAICQQGSESEPKSAAGQIITIFVFLAFMFLYTSYSAKIVALLQSTSESIKTVDDLLSSRIKLGVEDKPYSYYYFKVQTEKTRRAIYIEKIAPIGQRASFMDIEEGVKRMRDEFFAFHAECTSVYKIVGDTFQENEKCGLREIQYWQIIEPWMAVKRNSSYKELAKVAYRKIYESGLQSREFRRIYTMKPTCQSRGSNFISVGLIDCYYAFLIFGIGSLIAVGVLLMEIVYKRRISCVSGVVISRN